MKYYYLISSLPDIKVDYQNNNLLNISELYEFIERNLTEEDIKIYNALLLQNDNRNLLSLIFHEYHDLEYENIHEPSVIPFKTLQGYRRDASMLPDYITNFLLDNAGIFSSFSLSDIELKLRRYFINFVQTLNSEFLLQYYEWQYHLEEAIADINKKSFSFLNPHRSHDIDFPGSLPLLHHQIDKEQLASELLPMINDQRYADINKLIDSYYWQFADNWTEIFSANAVFAYVVKLLRLSRWSNVSADPEKVKELFIKLLNKVRTKNESPRMILV